MDSKIVIPTKKSKTARGLPKRTGKRGTLRARHGKFLGKRRSRGKAPSFKGVAVRVGGFYVELGKR